MPKKFKTKFLGLFIILPLPLFSLLVGCSTVSKNASLTADPQSMSSSQYFYLDRNELQQQRMQEFMGLYRDDKFIERDKINYLIDSIKNCDLQFVRNGESFDSKKAAKWLRWKMQLPQYSDDPIDTADEFVHRVANRSEKTGLPYQLVLPNGRYIEVQKVLEEELSTLEEALASYTQLKLDPLVKTRTNPQPATSNTLAATSVIMTTQVQN